jgi:hypothetical protein
MKSRLVFCIASALLLSSCGGIQYMLQRDVKPEIKPVPDKATLVIYRSTNYGFAVTIDNFIDGKFIGQTKGQSFFITRVEPGRHYVVAASENNSCARFDFEAGKVYYLLQAIFPGIMFARTGFIAKSASDAHQEMEPCGFYEVDPQAKVDDMKQDTYNQTVADFEKEVKEEPSRHQDVLEYKGY